MCSEEKGLWPQDAKETVLLCSSGFTGTVGAGDSPAVQLCEMKLLLTQVVLSASDLPVLRIREGKGRGFYSYSMSPGKCSWTSETLSISVALRENRVSATKQEDCLRLSAEEGELVYPSVLLPAALRLHLSEMEGAHVTLKSQQTLLKGEGPTADH